MIIMDMKIDNLYAFKNFHMNMSYPKKIVGSTISDEYLIDRPNFRYKKVNVIIGSNATGKTSLGKLIMFITNYFKDGVSQRFLGIINDSNKKSSLKMDFVTNENKLYRFSMNIAPQTFDSLDKNPVEISICYTNINKKDSYETCAKRLDEDDSKKTTIEKWFYPHKKGMMACTCAFGMGVDKKDIKTVIHLDPPQTAESFIQEAGRGGREDCCGRSFGMSKV